MLSCSDLVAPLPQTPDHLQENNLSKKSDRHDLYSCLCRECQIVQWTLCSAGFWKNHFETNRKTLDNYPEITNFQMGWQCILGYATVCRILRQ